MMTSLISGDDRRDTCVQAPASSAGSLKVARGLSTRAWCKLAVVQAPITSELPLTQAMGSSSSSEVMFLSSMVDGTSARPAAVLPPTITEAGAVVGLKIVARCAGE